MDDDVWRLDGAQVTTPAGVYAKTVAVHVDGTLRVLTRSGTLLAELADAVREQVSATVSTFTADGQVWTVEARRSCCGRG